MDTRQKKQNESGPSASFRVGAVALIFLIIGFQTAMFLYRASVTGIVNRHDRPDTVYVVDSGLARMLLERNGGEPVGGTEEASYGAESKDAGAYPRPANGKSGNRTEGAVTVRRNAVRDPRVEEIRLQNTSRTWQSFRFNPNTATVEELMSLGFSLKQAQSIDNYRQKGGRFRRKEDFARSFVVADTVFQRLEPFIDIPLLDINSADSAAFDALPGIGPYFAAKMVAYRDELCGYSFPEQLMDIWNFDKEKYDALSDLIFTGDCDPYPLWTLPEEELHKHPYIKHSAHALVLFRNTMPRSEWSVGALKRNAVLDPEMADRLARCRIAEP